MYRFYKSISSVGLLCLFAIWPVLMSGSDREGTTDVKVRKPSALVLYNSPANIVVKTAQDIACDEAGFLYDSLHLKDVGLSKEALEYAIRGYKKLIHNEALPNDSVISICDFSQSSRKKRLYVIDLRSKTLLVNTYVAHGKRSGKEFARTFSNKPESFKSSLGFFITRNTYQGANGLSLNIQGLEEGINDKAFERRIVIHSSNYVGRKYLKANNYSGTSLGCPAVPINELDQVIQTIKGGSCFFIYHPAKYYLTRSNILNG
jgi:hypothetical protein